MVKPFLVCRTCGGLIVTGTKNYIEGRQICRKCLDNNRENAKAYMRINNNREKQCRRNHQQKETE